MDSKAVFISFYSCTFADSFTYASTHDMSLKLALGHCTASSLAGMPVEMTGWLFAGLGCAAVDTASLGVVISLYRRAHTFIKATSGQHHATFGPMYNPTCGQPRRETT